MLHTSWNLLVKQARQKQIFTWWAILTGTLFLTPFLLISPELPTWQAWPYIGASVLAEVFYYSTLTIAYSLSDFSLVYPIARGTAPLFLLVWSILFLGETPTTIGLAGVALIIFGLVVIGSHALAAHKQSKQSNHSSPFLAIGLALVVALSISAYSAIDGAAVKHYPAFSYTLIVLGLTTIITAPLVWRYYGSRKMLREWKDSWRSIITVGVLTIVTYLLVLQAYRIGQISYAGAVREVSIVLAAFVGWRWLGETFGKLRIVGALLIFGGVLAIAFG